MLADGLPDDLENGWTWEREMAAQQLEATGEVVRVLIALVRLWVGDKDRDRITVPDPWHVPRPGDDVRPGAHQTAHVAPTATNGDDGHSWPPTLNVPSGRALVGRLLGGGGDD